MTLKKIKFVVRQSFSSLSNGVNGILPIKMILTHIGKIRELKLMLSELILSLLQRYYSTV